MKKLCMLWGVGVGGLKTFCPSKHPLLGGGGGGGGPQKHFAPINNNF